MPILTTLVATFPTYIFPSIPFRRRSSTPSTACNALPTVTGTSSTSSNETYLPSHAAVLRCTRCLAQICSTTQIISKGFTGRHGRAYLVGPASTLIDSASSASSKGAELANTNTATPPQRRQLATGVHTVCDISCALCGNVLGWKYVAAEEELQKYKVGKFILETKRVMRGTLWETDAADVEDGDDDDGRDLVREYAALDVDAGEKVEFDSGNDDECEDLFMGIWSEKLAKKRRKEKAWRVN